MQHLVSKTILSVLIMLGSFALIVIVRYRSEIDFDFRIPAIEVISLGVTFFLAWWIADKIEKGRTEERFEKQLIIDKLKELDCCLKDFKQWIDVGGSFLSSLLVGKLTEYRGIASNISEALDENYKSISDDYKSKKSLPRRLTELKKLCTFIPLRPQDDEIVLNEDEYSYNSDRVDKIDKMIVLIRQEIFHLQLRINKE